jgi:hypothetical protein
MKLMAMGQEGILQFPAIAAGMIGIAIAVTILAAAMKIFATMSWEDIAKGMAGVAGSISAVGVAMRLLPGGGAGLVVQAAGLIILGVSLNVIAAAMKIFATMKWQDIAKGLVGVVGAIAGIGAAMLIMPPTLPLTAAGLLILSAALVVIGGVVALFGNMDIVTMTQGLIGMTPGHCRYRPSGGVYSADHRANRGRSAPRRTSHDSRRRGHRYTGQHEYQYAGQGYHRLGSYIGRFGGSV